MSFKNTQKDIVNDQKLFLEELVNFYEKFYSETETNNCKLGNNLFFQKIDEKKNIECEKPGKEWKCFCAVSEQSNNKSLGLNGFSIEFYKTFWQN